MFICTDPTGLTPLYDLLDLSEVMTPALPCLASTLFVATGWIDCGERAVFLYVLDCPRKLPTFVVLGFVSMVARSAFLLALLIAVTRVFCCYYCCGLLFVGRLIRACAATIDCLSVFC